MIVRLLLVSSTLLIGLSAVASTELCGNDGRPNWARNADLKGRIAKRACVTNTDDGSATLTVYFVSPTTKVGADKSVQKILSQTTIFTDGKKVLMNVLEDGTQVNVVFSREGYITEFSGPSTEAHPDFSVTSF
jgi:hypothetical protein